MTANPYPVLGANVPPMLGRGALLSTLESRLTKDPPDHVSVVGPKHYGKSVVLKHIADKHRTESGRFLTSVYLDLRHDPPQDDASFRRRLGAELRAALSPVHAEAAGYIDVGEEDSLHELITLSLDELHGQGLSVLVVLDGFDHVMQGTELTPNLLRQLRTLSQKESLTLLASSRRPLRELCRTEETRSSNFWEVFGTNFVRVEPFTDADIEALLTPFVSDSRVLDSGARKEVRNWTGGVPVLVAALLFELWDATRSGAPIGKDDVDAAGERTLVRHRILLADVWEDCGAELQSDLVALVEGPLRNSEVSMSRRMALENRGFVLDSRGGLHSACRLLARFAQEQGPSASDLDRLFGANADFEKSIHGLLELRLAQLREVPVDQVIHEYVETAVRDLTRNPALSLMPIRTIAKRALDLVWQAELADGKTLPHKWCEEWKHAGIRYPEERGERPRAAGAQCGLLRLASGTEKVEKLLAKISKPTCLLIDHLQSVGDFGQHREDFGDGAVPFEFAVSVIFDAMALAEGLARDIAG